MCKHLSVTAPPATILEICKGAKDSILQHFLTVLVQMRRYLDFKIKRPNIERSY